MESFLKTIIVLVIIFGTLGGLTAIYADPVPVLKDGDVIFRTNLDSGSTAIMAATENKYTHVGVIKNTPQGLAVIDTTPEGHKATLIEKWIDRGFMNRYSVYRYRNLKPERQVGVINNLYKQKDMKYDYFMNPGNEEIYNSELVYNAFLEAGVQIGKLQKMRHLNLDNPFGRNLIQPLLSTDPECKGKTRDECYKIIINRDVITPASLADDLNLEMIYSNYPF